ncbi:DUF1768-domain-containing protein [Xylaria intraflava]|nr:DUF1768-domain-containing protein [Xylaria intraflava]
MAPKRKNSSTTASKNQRARRTKSVSPPSVKAAPVPDGPIYFWRPQEVATGYLSQWYAQPFRDRADPTKIYATAEHYMMHHKALLFGDAEIAAEILKATSPRSVKALGRKVRGFDGAVWAQEREKIVTEGNWCKFSLPVVENSEEAREEKKGGDDNDDSGLRTWRLGDGKAAQTIQTRSFRDVLLATGTRELVEASPFDRIWGIGFAAKSAESKRDKWGMNLLGKCLMSVREQFRKAGAAKLEEAGCS